MISGMTEDDKAAKELVAEYCREKGIDLAKTVNKIRHEHHTGLFEAIWILLRKIEKGEI